MQRSTSPVLLLASHKHSSCLSKLRHAATLERQPGCCIRHLFLMQSAAQIAFAAMFRSSTKPQMHTGPNQTQIQAMTQLTASSTTGWTAGQANAPFGTAVQSGPSIKRFRPCLGYVSQEPLLRLLTKSHLFCKKQEDGVLTVLYCRTKEAEVAALAEIASHSSRGQEEAQKSTAKAHAVTQRLEADIQRLQRYITHIENSNRQAFSNGGVVSCTYLTRGNQCVLKATV